MTRQPTPVNAGLLAAALRPDTRRSTTQGSNSPGPIDPFAPLGATQGRQASNTGSRRGTRRGSWPWESLTEDSSTGQSDAELDRMVSDDVATTLFRQQRDAWYARIPAKFRGAGADTNHPAVLDRLARLRSGTNQIGMLIHGHRGRGKTWVAYSLANMAIDERLIQPGCVTAGTEADILGAIALAPFQEMERRTTELLNPRTKLLILDDVGRASYFRPESRVGLFDRVVDWAWRNDVLMVVTTNLALGPKGALAQWVGPAAYDRLISAVGPPVSMDERLADMRQMIAEDEENAARSQHGGRALRQAQPAPTTASRQRPRTA